MVPFKFPIYCKSHLLSSPPQGKDSKYTLSTHSGPSTLSSQSLRPGAGNTDSQLEKDSLLVCFVLERAVFQAGPMCAVMVK